LITNPVSLLGGQLENGPVVTVVAIDEFDGQEINFLVGERAHRSLPAGAGQAAYGSERNER
jgi:hypothetical protein